MLIIGYAFIRVLGYVLNTQLFGNFYGCGLWSTKTKTRHRYDTTL